MREMKKKIELINFFINDNKSGFKSKERWLKKNHESLYLDIINFTKNYKNNLTFKEKIWLFINGVTAIPKCECGKELKFKKSIKDGFGKYCSIKCANKSKEHINKIKKTNIKKYGGVSPMNSDKIKNKVKDSNLKRYGVENIFQDIDYIKEKTIKKCGVSHISKLDDVKNKRADTNLKKYGISTPLLDINNRYRNKLSKIKNFNVKYSHLNVINDLGDNIIIKCDVCDTIYTINRSVLFHRNKITKNPCTNCHPIKSGTSILEKELSNFILTLGLVYEENNRTILNGKELDIYIPSKKIGIEFNGLHWHSEKYLPNDYHLNKTNLSNNKGVKLIHIFEDEWVNKKDIVKSRIKNILGLTENKIYGRKCAIKSVSTKEKSKFLENNHTQGKVGSKVNLGLYYNDELVSLMTFGKRKILRNSNWELIRFCNKLDTVVIGGASKLFKYFIKNYEFNEIISYADRRWSQGNLYNNMEFKFDSLTPPNYYYVFNNNRENRVKYQKHKLIKMGFDKNLTEHQIMVNKGIYRIYDCGNFKYVYKKNP